MAASAEAEAKEFTRRPGNSSSSSQPSTTASRKPRRTAAMPFSRRPALAPASLGAPSPSWNHGPSHEASVQRRAGRFLTTTASSEGASALVSPPTGSVSAVVQRSHLSPRPAANKVATTQPQGEAPPKFSSVVPAPSLRLSR